MSMTFDERELALARDYLEGRRKRRKEEWLALHKKAAQDAARIIAMIIERYKPARIYQWGSLLQEDNFRD